MVDDDDRHAVMRSRNTGYDDAAAAAALPPRSRGPLRDATERCTAPWYGKGVIP
jgi:hypothetical protein